MPNMNTNGIDYVSKDDNKLPQTEQHDDQLIIASVEEIWACQISRWYPIFSNLPRNNNSSQKKKHRSSVTVKSVIIDLPDPFLKWLHDDGLILPEGANVSSILLQESEKQQQISEGWSDEFSYVTSHESCEGNVIDPKTTSNDDLKLPMRLGSKPKNLYSFLDLNQEIEDAIELLYSRYIVTDASDKAIFPKLNWSSPKDSVWINNGSMKCCSSGDIYMLIKASEFCSYDVNMLPDLTERLTSFHQTTIPEHIIDSPPKLQLCLRKWCCFYPSQEFRCFIRNEQIIGICQRHDTQYWSHLTEETIQDEYMNLMISFYEDMIQPNLQNNNELYALSNCVIDVYIDKKSIVWLVDINIWSNRTDPLLFTWSELIDLETSSSYHDDIIFKVVETSKQIKANPLSCYKAPIDTLYMTSSQQRGSNGLTPYGPTELLKETVDDNSIPGLFETQDAFNKFMAQCQQPESDTDDDDDDVSD